MINLSEWPSESQAAEMLGTSVKTVLRYANDGKIEMRKRPRTGKKPENVFNPRDIEKLLPKAHVMPTGESADSEEWMNAPMGKLNGVARIPEQPITFAYVLSELLRRTTPPAIAPPRPWITLEEAAEMSGLSTSYLLRQVKEGKVEGVRGGPHGALRIRRASLEAFAG